MHNVYVINLNPTYDVHYRVNSFEPYSESYGFEECRNIGGKGVNVALSLVCAGKKALCVCPVGMDNGKEFKEKLSSSGCDTMFIDCSGKVRENVTIHKEGFPDTRISLDSFYLDKKILDGICDNLLKRVRKDDILAFCGRLPKGITTVDACEFLLEFKKLGVRIVIDSNSFGYDDIVKVNPWLIKPNENEILAMYKKDEDANILDLATKLHLDGVDNVLVSLGDKGAYFVTQDKKYHCRIPSVVPLSTVGAGDNTVAGFIYAALENESTCELLKYACSFGTASCLEQGTNPPKFENVMTIYKKMSVIEV